MDNKEVLLAYELNEITDTSFELTVRSLTSGLASFLELNPIFLSKSGTLITYIGSRLVLEPRDPPSGRPQGIILPQLQGSNSSWTSERSIRSTMAYEARRPDITEIVSNDNSASERARGEWSCVASFKCSRDKIDYVNGICRAMSDLVQAFLDTIDSQKNRAVTLIIIN